MTKGWSLHFIDKYNKNYLSNDIIYTDINKFLEYFKFKINLIKKAYGEHFNKNFFMYKNLDDYNVKYIEEIIDSEYIYYNNNMDIACLIKIINY
jgi:hypothetical protein